MWCIQILYSYNEAKTEFRVCCFVNFQNGTSESLTMSINTFFIWHYFVTRTCMSLYTHSAPRRRASERARDTHSYKSFSGTHGVV